MADLSFLKSELIKNKKSYEVMSESINPYGDGKAVMRIVNIIKEYLG